MKRGRNNKLLLLLTSLLVISIFSITLISAGWFSGFFGKITGYVISNYTCYDSDGGKNYYVKGSALGSDSTNYTDLCYQADKRIFEYFCNTTTNMVGGEWHNCENGCLNGVCLGCAINCSGKQCGSDGCGGSCGNCSSGQTCNSNWKCVNLCTAKTCSELGKQCGSWPDGCNGTVNCPSCPSGQTCNANGQCESSNITSCTDSDGGINYLVKGTCIDKGWYGNISRTHTDVCGYTIDEIYHPEMLIEFRCNETSRICWHDEFSCPNGCSNGACISNITSSCTDSDGGKKKYVKGNTCLGSNCKEDSCRVQIEKYYNYSVLTEYFCEDNYRYDDSWIRCSNGCVDGACKRIIPVENDVCQDIINLIANPEDFEIYSKKYTNNNWDYHYNSEMWINDKSYKFDEYSTSWYTYSEGEETNYEYTNINADLIVFKDKSIDLSKWIDSLTSYRICKVDSFYDDKNKENIIYICNWDVLNNRQSLENYNHKSRQIFWIKQNVVIELDVYMGKTLTKEQIQKIASQKVNDFISSLINNQAKYIDWENFDISGPAYNFISHILSNCDSDLTRPVNEEINETCYPSWECKIEPVICPPHGYQKKICRDYSCDKEREETLYCNPGICSGCYVPRWFGYNNMDNICIPYGIRLAHQEKTSKTKIIGGIHPDYELIFEEGFAKLKVKDKENNIIFESELYEGGTYDIDFSGYGGEKIQFRVKSIVNTESDSENVGYAEIEIMKNFNAYCDYDGIIKKQKSVDSGGNWASCQNNYECQSNFCSDGECIEAMRMIKEASTYKALVVKILCRFANLFNIEKYQQCILDRLR